jgi:hypothetical protein
MLELSPSLKPSVLLFTVFQKSQPLYEQNRYNGAVLSLLCGDLYHVRGKKKNKTTATAAGLESLHSVYIHIHTLIH